MLCKCIQGTDLPLFLIVPVSSEKIRSVQQLPLFLAHTQKCINSIFQARKHSGDGNGVLQESVNFCIAQIIVSAADQTLSNALVFEDNLHCWEVSTIFPIFPPLQKKGPGNCNCTDEIEIFCCPRLLVLQTKRPHQTLL